MPRVREAAILPDLVWCKIPNLISAEFGNGRHPFVYRALGPWRWPSDLLSQKPHGPTLMMASSADPLLRVLGHEEK
jgi:hypothetical protein